MQNAIKPRLSPAEVASLVHTGLGEAVDVVQTVEFTDGFFNAAHGVLLADGRDLVLKVAPPAELTLLRYEVDLMRTEIHFFERAAAARVPVPELRYADPDAGVMLMDRLRGHSLYAVAGDLPREALLAIRRQLGGLMGRITGVTGLLFGYPRRDGRTRSPSWRASFLSIIDDVLLDCIELDAELPLPAEQIASLIARHAPLLDEVTTPCLVHFDLWDGNIFVVDDGNGWRIEGIIDGERALYADPLMELVPVACFTAPDQADIVVDGMLGRELTEAERIRLRVYCVYLYLILAAEPATRGYDAVEFEPTRQRFYQQLAGELAQL